MQTNEVLRPDDSTFDYTDHVVLDEQGVRIGVVVDVVESPDRPSAEFLVVAPGHLRAPHYVPIARSYHTNDGKIVVPWDRHWVLTGPKATGDHIPTPEIRRELAQHFTSL